MFADLPESVDVWRMVAARRVFEGRIALGAMPRLATSLADAEGACAYRIGFDRNEQGQAMLELELETSLPLVCQRTLERFELPLVLHQRLGLIRAEQEEAALPAGFEALLVPTGGALSLAEVIEDELILAIPVVPMSDEGLQAGDVAWQDPLEDNEGAPGTTNPFAVLAGLRDKH